MYTFIAQNKYNESKNLMIIKVCFYVSIISNLILYIAQPLHIVILETLASRSFMLSNIVALFFVFSHCLKSYIPYKTQLMISILFMLAYSFLSFLISNSCGFYIYLVRIICYLALPIYLIYVDYLRPDKRMINTIYIINILTSLVFIALSFSKYRYAGYEIYMGTDKAWLTLGYFNPNQTAMYLIVNIIVLLSALSYYKKRIFKGLLLMDILYLCLLLLDTSSRTSIGIGIIILMATIFNHKKRISKLMVLTTLAIPLVFLLLYPWAYENGLIYLLEFGGKMDFSSRSVIFTNILKSVKDQFLFGNFSAYQLQNLHNGVLSVYSSLGLVGLFFFYNFYIRAYLHLQESSIQSRTAYIAMIGLLSIFIHSCTESAFLVGGSVYAGSLSVLILLAKLDSKDVS